MTNTPVKFTKKGQVEWGVRTFGFLDAVVAVTHVGDSSRPKKLLPPTKQRLEIYLSPAYAEILQMNYGNKNFLCSVPVAALEAARSLPAKQVQYAKNLVYHLAGRGGRGRMKLETLVDVMGLHIRWPKETTNMVEAILQRMAEKNVLTWRRDEHGTYWLTLGTRKETSSGSANAVNSDSETKFNNHSEN